jgi:hypothetical protein
MKLRIHVIALFFLIALALPPARHLCALPACELERRFYSDGTFTATVGDYYVSCSYGIIRSGHSSCYYDHIEYGECGYGQGTCGGLDFRCSNQVITDASNPAYIGASCPCYPVF